MATITDVSKLANVSKATVSRVMSGSRSVKQQSREAVLRAAEALNYRPNIAAQSLATKTTGYVGVILSTLDAGQVATYLPLIAKALKQRDKQLIVQFADTAVEYQQQIESLTGGHCDAVIAIGAPYPLCQQDNVIAIDSAVDAQGRRVGNDFYFATETACRYLSGKGHTSIAILVDDDGYVSNQAIEGYKVSLQNSAIPINRRLIVKASENAEQALLSLISSYSPFTALIVMRDSQAALAIKLLKDFNLATPQEVSLLSLENSTLAQQLSPALTCISYPSEKLVQLAMQHLDDYFQGEAPKETSLVAGTLVTRDSVIAR